MRREIAFLAALAALGCGVKAAETKVAVDENGNIESATLPDGTVVDGQGFEAAIAASTPGAEEMGETTFTVEASQKALNLGKGVDIGKFRVQILPDAGYLEGCIRKSFLHLKIAVTNTKIDMGAMVELHLVAWFDGGSPCFGVMNTGFVGHGWCQKMCMKDVKKGVSSTIKNGLIAAGVTASVATAVSLVTAPVATAALAL